MILQDILKDDEVVTIVEALSRMSFVDGKLTARGRAAERKDNLQMDRSAEGAVELEKMILEALVRHPVLSLAALPKSILPPTFSRYDTNMTYGFHLDSPFMKAGKTSVRTDLAMTVFLNDPATYDGGELVVQTNSGETGVKLDAGDGFLYFSGTRHRVNPVTKGVRLVAVTWIESRIRDQHLRDLIYDLAVARELMKQKDKDAPGLELVEKVYVNMLRMWGES